MISEAHCIDCLDFMKQQPDKRFDLVVADPPYGDPNNIIGGGTIRRAVREVFRGIALQGDGGRGITIKNTPPTAENGWNRFQGGTWAERYRRPEAGVASAPTWDVAPRQEFFDELFRVGKNVIIWGGNYFSLPPTRCFLVWRKTNIGENFSMAMCEYAWTNFKGNAKLFNHTSLRDGHSGKFHPTEKPLSLYQWIYRMFAKPGDLIFDPMMGSQASRVAAYMMGLDYVGCEIDRYYFDKGQKYFERECHGIVEDGQGNAKKQLRLF